MDIDAQSIVSARISDADIARYATTMGMPTNIPVAAMIKCQFALLLECSAADINSPAFTIAHACALMNRDVRMLIYEGKRSRLASFAAAEFQKKANLIMRLLADVMNSVTTPKLTGVVANTATAPANAEASPLDSGVEASSSRIPDKSTRSRAWCFTVNNFTPDDETRLQGLECEYLVYGREHLSNGTPHLQGYVYFSSARTLGGLKKKVRATAHFEPARGTPAQNKAYCTKEDTSFFEKGQIPSPGSRSDIAEMRESVKNGAESLKTTELLMKYRANTDTVPANTTARTNTTALANAVAQFRMSKERRILVGEQAAVKYDRYMNLTFRDDNGLIVTHVPVKSPKYHRIQTNACNWTACPNVSPDDENKFGKTFARIRAVVALYDYDIRYVQSEHSSNKLERAVIISPKPTG